MLCQGYDDVVLNNFLHNLDFFLRVEWGYFLKVLFSSITISFKLWRISFLSRRCSHCISITLLLASNKSSFSFKLIYLCDLLKHIKASSLTVSTDSSFEKKRIHCTFHQNPIQSQKLMRPFNLYLLLLHPCQLLLSHQVLPRLSWDSPWSSFCSCYSQSFLSFGKVLKSFGQIFHLFYTWITIKFSVRELFYSLSSLRFSRFVISY